MLPVQSREPDGRMMTERSALDPGIRRTWQLATMLARARNAFQMEQFPEATALAVTAFDLAARTVDSTTTVLVDSFEPTLARIFLQELGSPTRILVPSMTPGADELSLSPRTAFLMSRLGPGMSVTDAFDVASMPRLETLRRLLALVTCGAVHLEQRIGRRSAVAEPPHAGALAYTIVANPFR